MEAEIQVPEIQADWATFEELFNGTPFELVSGKVIRVSPSGLLASVIAAEIVTELKLFNRNKKLGFVTGADGGFKLDDKNMRAPDAAFISKARLETQTDLSKFAEAAPELAVEVISPGDLASEVQQKIVLYFQHGVQMLWIVYPHMQEVVVHLPDRTTRTLTKSDTLDGAPVLPGFSLPVASIFADLP
jgi:Uma2 family endonuclease